ncbi:hypothetical protein OHT20_12635 [Streptomyces caniferus]|uniref:Uncharacterized protein n=1 Tax=Streptomyces caniferus TaxID=285557 RepID=A0A640S2I5_9ACTN|nr:hypothetical protein [Streptomyces caniferus]GFE04646.1 hypothetical protein Scani_09140 [Streptomyces caniferus]
MAHTAGSAGCHRLIVKANPANWSNPASPANDKALSADGSHSSEKGIGRHGTPQKGGRTSSVA